MKRGLVVLDEDETSLRELKERVSTLQGSLAEKGLAAALVYGDVYHSGDITYLSNICLYWNEAILAVPARGEPALLTKLSRRVQPWMKRTSSLEDLRSGPHLAAAVNEFVGELDEGRIGFVEETWWPAPLLADVREALGGRGSIDLGGIVRQRRETPSDSELQLLRTASELTARSVGVGLDTRMTPNERAGRAELTARQGGVEDVAVYSRAVAPDADTLEVVAEYRGYWTAAARVLTRATIPWAQAMDAAYREAASFLRDGITADALSSGVARHLSGSSLPWCLELMHHVDVETGGGYRLPVQRHEPVRTGAVVSMRLAMELPSGQSAVGADTYAIGTDRAERLTRHLPNDVVVSVA